MVNVHGPDRPLYWNRAKLEATYPAQLTAFGGVLNITYASYAGTTNLRFTGCRDTLPHMQRIAGYPEEVLDQSRGLLVS